jgi:hypothetical protein
MLRSCAGWPITHSSAFGSQVWGLFMEPQHSGIVEIFTTIRSDPSHAHRGSGNRHYHNIASYVDLHYRAVSRAPLANAVSEAVQGITSAISNKHEAQPSNI